MCIRIWSDLPGYSITLSLFSPLKPQGCRDVIWQSYHRHNVMMMVALWLLLSASRTRWSLLFPVTKWPQHTQFACVWHKWNKGGFFWTCKHVKLCCCWVFIKLGLMAVSRLCEDTVDAEEHIQVLHFHADFYISHIETFSSRTYTRCC